MKILFMSDTHLGFAAGGEREEDAFLTFEEGIKKGLLYDAILLGGDIFDTRIPTQETFSRTMEILLAPRKISSPLALTGIGKSLNRSHNGLPVISISGNHERRVKGLVNPVEALEKGDFLVHLHANGIILEKNGERAAIQGLSSVPTAYLDAVLKEWNPCPVPGAYNILLIHQNIKGFVRAPDALPKEQLPEGFDLYLCGDIHERHVSSVHGKPLILPGSTVATQINKDAMVPRSSCLLDTALGKWDFIPFENQRKIFYESLETREEVQSRVQSILEEQHPLKPVIKIKTSLSKIELPIADAILMVAHDHPEIMDKAALTEAVGRSGKELLRKNLEEAKLDPRIWEAVFDLLLEKKYDQVVSLLGRKTKSDNDQQEDSPASRESSTDIANPQ